MFEPEIAIISCGIGNVGSVANMIRKSGGKPVLINTPTELKKFNFIVLPGVGQFGNAITKLNSTGWIHELNACNDSGKWILGICIGMHLMCLGSEESPDAKGLGWINALVKRLPNKRELNLRVPHMGWNQVMCDQIKSKKYNIFEKDIMEFYFAHSYYVSPNDASIILTTTEHTINFTSAFQKDNLYGVQFHPEKSHNSGLALFKRFISL